MVEQQLKKSGILIVVVGARHPQLLVIVLVVAAAIALPLQREKEKHSQLREVDLKDDISDNSLKSQYRRHENSS